LRDSAATSGRETATHLVCPALRRVPSRQDRRVDSAGRCCRGPERARSGRLIPSGSQALSDAVSLSTGRLPSRRRAMHRRPGSAGRLTRRWFGCDRWNRARKGARKDCHSGFGTVTAARSLPGLAEGEVGGRHPTSNHAATATPVAMGDHHSPHWLIRGGPHAAASGVRVTRQGARLLSRRQSATGTSGVVEAVGRPRSGGVGLP
jgi:hypothetical protein